MYSLPMASNTMAAEQFRLQLPQWVQASNSMIWRVSMLAGKDLSGSMTRLDIRLKGVAIKWNILLKGR